jgi:hypothetical protein
MEKLYRWGALPLVILIYATHERLTLAAQALLTREFLWDLQHFLRGYLLYPLLGSGAILLAVAVATRASLRKQAVALADRPAVLVLASALLAFVIFAAAGGREQNISFFRYSSFIVPPLIVAGVALWSVALDHIVPRPSLRTVWAALIAPVMMAGVFAATVASFPDRQMFKSHLANSLAFASGRFSIDRAYTTQSLAGRYPWGAIYPGARGAYAVVGPHTPIWSFSIPAYCMLPECTVATYPAFLIGDDWDVAVFGEPDQAKAALQKAGINYFLFSREFDSIDPLMKSPLFDPDHIARYLGIRWTDGTTALLTWLGPDVQPLDEAWIESFRSTAAEVPKTDFLKSIFAGLRATPHPWHAVTIP